MSVFFGTWSCVEDVERDFEAPGCLDECEVLFATYDYANYSGNAHVIYLDQDGDMWEATAGHCSCYGLEGRWSPGPVTQEALAVRPDPTKPGKYGFDDDMSREARAALEVLYHGKPE